MGGKREGKLQSVSFAEFGRIRSGLCVFQIIIFFSFFKFLHKHKLLRALACGK